MDTNATLRDCDISQHIYLFSSPGTVGRAHPASGVNRSHMRHPCGIHHFAVINMGRQRRDQVAKRARRLRSAWGGQTKRGRHACRCLGPPGCCQQSADGVRNLPTCHRRRVSLAHRQQTSGRYFYCAASTCCSTINITHPILGDSECGTKSAFHCHPAVLHDAGSESGYDLRHVVAVSCA